MTNAGSLRWLPSFIEAIEARHADTARRQAAPSSVRETAGQASSRPGWERRVRSWYTVQSRFQPEEDRVNGQFHSVSLVGSWSSI